MQNRLREIRTHDLTFRAYDSADSWAASMIAKEIAYQYVVPDLVIKPNDVIIDIGAHVGIFSMYYALKYPTARIYSYEPTGRNYNNFVKSLEYNGIKNVIPHNLAVTSDGRSVVMNQPSDNTGASSIFYNPQFPVQEKNVAKSVTLEEIFEEIKTKKRVKILKIDCEGAEYEILRDHMHLLRDVDCIMGELHHVPDSEFNAKALYTKINEIVGQERNKLTIIQTNTIV